MLLVKSKESKNSARIIAQPLLGGLSLFSHHAFAQSASPTSASSIVSILLSLVVVVAVIFMMGYLMRRFNVTQTGSQQMKVISSMMLGNKERVMLVQVGDEQHLLGVTSQNINHLSKMVNPVIEQEQSGESFKNKLSLMMQNNKNSKERRHD